MLFPYSSQVHSTKHGPQGYRDASSFKPWLRDEFSYRCVYCLWRETWCQDGDDSFSVEHIAPQSSHPDQTCEYDNLLYACCRCNSLKRDVPLPFNPNQHAWGDHLQTDEDGTVVALSDGGERVIEICRLNRPALVAARQRIVQLLATLRASNGEKARSLLQSYVGFPDNLPVLSKLRPPGGNSRPDGIAQSSYALRGRRELPESY